MAYLIANLMRISKIAMKISINVILRHNDVIKLTFLSYFDQFIQKNNFKINSLVETWYDLYIVYKRCFVAFSYYLGQKEQATFLYLLGICLRLFNEIWL